MLELLLMACLWAGLTLVFLWRARTIAGNLLLVFKEDSCVVAGVKLRWPAIRTLRPFKQALILVAELWLVLTFYSLFGVSILAHITAAICGCGVMIALREKDASSFLESLQLTPIVAA